MAALSADILARPQGSVHMRSGLANAADTYYRGAIVYIDTGGGVQVTAAAGDRPIGICTRKQVVSAGDRVEFVWFGVIRLPLGSGIAAADEGDLLVNDGPTDTDNPADMVAAGDITPAANDACIGKILEVGSNYMDIAITPGLTGMLYVATVGWGG